MTQRDMNTGRCLLDEVVQPLVDRFALAIDMTVMLCNADQSVIVSSQGQGCCSHCSCQIGTTTHGGVLFHAANAVSSPFIHRCAAEYLFVVSPIMVDQAREAVLVAGPFHHVTGTPCLRSNHEQMSANVCSSSLQQQEAPAVLLERDVSRLRAHVQTMAELIEVKAAQALVAARQQRLAEHAAAWQALTEHSSLGIAICRHEESVPLEANTALAVILDVSPDEILGQPLCLPLSSPGISVEDDSSVEKTANNPAGHHVEIILAGRESRPLLHLTTAYVSGHEQRKIHLLVDTSCFEQQRATSREKRQSLHCFLQAVPLGLIIYHQQKLLMVNKKICEISGYSEAELLNRSTRDFYLSQEEFERVHRHLSTSMWESGEIRHVETRCLCRDGSVRDIAMFAAPIDPNNPDAGAAVAVQDITEYKLNEEALRLSRDKLQSLFRAAPVGLSIIRGRHLYAVNEMMSTITGYEAGELSLMHARQLYATTEEYNKVGQALYDTLWQTGKSEVETTFMHKDGSIRIVYLSMTPIDSNNHEAGVAAACQDITDRKKTEMALLQHQAMLQGLFHAVPVGLAIIKNRVFSAVNKEMALITGYSPVDLVDTPTRKLYVSNDEFFRVRAELYGELWQRGKSRYVETQILRPDGSQRDVALFAAPVDVHDPEAGAAVAVQDITQQKQMLRQLQESEQRFRVIADFTGQLLYDYEVASGRMVWSGKAEEMTGYSLANLNALGFKGWEQQVHPEDRNEVLARLQVAIERKIVFKAEYRLRKADATYIHVEDEGAFFYDEQHQPVRMLGIIRDITDQKNAEKALRESEFRFRSFYNTNPESILLLDFQGIILDVNKAFLKESGYTLSQCVGQHFMEFVEDAFTHGQIVQAILSLKSGLTRNSPLEISYKTAQGDILPVAAKGWLVVDEGSKPLYIGVFMKNLAIERALAEEKVGLEKQIIQSQKSEAIGTLAGGIAHDFNNILGGLIGYTELALLRTPLSAEPKAREYLQRALEIGLRAKELVQQILRFSRHSKMTMEPINLIPIVKETTRLLRSTIPTTIHINAHIQAEHDQILGDSNQIHQVLMNLGTNAFHAMKQDGGQLTISLQQTHVATPKRFLTMEIPAGQYLQLSIEDTGRGIPSHVLERIFEPYFTTKEVNEGTGLGLAVTLGIVKGHQGLIEVNTQLGQGTRFSVYLPLSDVTATQKQATRTGMLPLGHGERILIVDDEDFFREVIAEGLSLLGYQVTEQHGSLQTLATIRQDPYAFDLLLTDLTMPDMTGVQLAQQVLVLNSSMPIILCTGFSEFITEENAATHGIAQLLMKPVNIEQLAMAVHAALASRRYRQ